MCRSIWQFVQSIGAVASTLWEWVYGPWRTCSAQQCNWWCLCCNKWLCWIALILLAVLLIVFFILYVIWSIFLLITCESLCVTITLIQALGKDIRVQCFKYWDDPAPPPPGGSGTGTGALTSPPTTPGTGTGTGTGTRNHLEYSLTKKAMRWWPLLTRTATIRLALSNVDEEQSRLLQSTIDRHIATCGCPEGQIGMSVAIALFVLFLLIDPWSIHMTGWVKFGVGFGVVFVGALIGKLTGLFRARVLLRKSIRALARSLQAG